MTVVARRVIATPARSASTAWTIIVNLIAPDKGSDARNELESISGIATNLIADEALESAAAVVYGSGPRVRIYCLYDDEAIAGDMASESSLAFNPTHGEWRMSLPCLTEDLDWVNDALKTKSSRITARDFEEDVEPDEDSNHRKASSDFEIDREAFFNS